MEYLLIIIETFYYPFIFSLIQIKKPTATQAENRAPWVVSIRREFFVSWTGKLLPIAHSLMAQLLVSSFSLGVCSLSWSRRLQDTNCSFMLSCDHWSLSPLLALTVLPPRELDEQWADPSPKSCLAFHLFLHLTVSDLYSSWKCPAVVSVPWGWEVPFRSPTLPYESGSAL